MAYPVGYSDISYLAPLPFVSTRGKRSALKLGIIGCGRAASQLHLPALRHVPEIEVVRLADVGRQRLAALGDRFGIEALHLDYRQHGNAG